MRRLMLFTTFLLLGGCASLPFQKNPGIAPPVELGAAQLAKRCWPEPQKHYRIRQTVLFELRGARVPMNGLMDLDTRSGEIRLVALNDLGVKFFDLHVTGEGQQLHYLLPDLKRFPDFDVVVANAVRRIFLAPRPDGSEILQRSSTRTILERPASEPKIEFEFGGNDARLYTVRARGSEQKWQIDYYEYPQGGASAPPRGVILDDHKAGYRLTLWLDEVTQREP